MTVNSASSSVYNPSSVFGNAAESKSAEPDVKTADSTDIANKDTFLRLLVTQLQAQNPLNPKDGSEFVAQLATFTQLEQTLGIRQDLEAIREKLTAPVAGATE